MRKESALIVDRMLCDKGIKELRTIDANRIVQKTCSGKFQENRKKDLQAKVSFIAQLEIL